MDDGSGKWGMYNKSNVWLIVSKHIFLPAGLPVACIFLPANLPVAPAKTDH